MIVIIVFIMTMHTPPDFLREIMDGAFESVFVVLSNGIIWHMNKSARQIFHVISAGANDEHTHVSTYLSFYKTNAPNHKKLEVTWGDFSSEAGPFTNETWITSGIGTPSIGDIIPLTINIIRVTSSAKDLDRSVEEKSGQRHASSYYVLYMQNVASTTNENRLQSQTQNSIITTDSGNTLIITVKKKLDRN